jgi:hypothetical protein
MAISEDKNRLFTTVKDGNEIGIALWEIYSCLRYYKKDKAGKRNLSLPIQFGDINKWAKHKPFRCGKWNFATEEERDADRKEAHQGLNIPTAANAGITSTRGKTYLGELAYRALSVAGTPNWEYLRPRGVTDVYNEPFRVLDFDGYNHLAKQPFDTKGSINNSGTMMLLPPAGNTEVKVNRFVSTGLRFTLQMGVTNVDISMADLLYGSDSDFYFLVAEKYVDSNVSGKDYYQRDPDEVLKAPTSIAEIPQNGGSSIIDYALEAANDNKQIRFVVGINEYTSNAADADIQTRGYGFIAPYAPPSNIPFLYTIRQEYYGVFDMRYDRGFYLPNLGASWQTYDLNVFDYEYKETDTDIVGISIKVRKRAVPYRIGSKNHSFSPAEVNSKTGYKFELDTQNGVRVVAELTDETMTSSVQYVEIPMRGGSEDEWHTVYLKFPNALPSRGSQIAFGLLRISTDNGATFTEINASSMGAGYIEAGCAGSSANIYQRRK